MSTGGSILESEIKSALVTRIRKHSSGLFVWPEMTICDGAARVDVGVVGKNISGYEIKSEGDNLSRLRRQAWLYGKVLKRATLVTVIRHTDEATKIIPPWWGILVVHRINGGIVFTRGRRECVNPSIRPLSVAQMLWRDETIEELRERGLAKGITGAGRYLLWQKLAASVSLSELTNIVVERIVNRDWDATPWGKYKRALEEFKQK